MKTHKLIRMLLEQAGAPADAGGAGTPPPAGGTPGTEAQPPADGGSAEGNGNPPAGGAPAQGADNPPPADNNQSLLGGAKSGSAETNPNGGKPGGGQKQPPADPYESLKVSDGAAADKDTLAGYKQVAGELKLTVEQAQRLYDYEQQRLTDQAAQAANAWKEEVQKKYGDQLQPVMATCARALDKLGGQPLRDLLDQTGLGNHPVLVEAFYKAGALIKEDKSVPPTGQQGKTDKTFAQALYGSSN